MASTRQVSLSAVVAVLAGYYASWYYAQFLASPHPSIVGDILRGASLREQQQPKTGRGRGAGADGSSPVTVENWTKWRLLVEASPAGGEAASVVPANSRAAVELGNQSVIRVEFREGLEIRAAISKSGELVAESGVLRGDDWWSGGGGGIGNAVQVGVVHRDGGDHVLRVVPRFLFGLSHETALGVYGGDAANFPYAGLVCQSTGLDRALLASAMTALVALMCLHVLATAPPEWKAQALQAAATTTTRLKAS